MSSEKKIGKITHYFSKAGVGVLELTEGDLKIGDIIKIQGPKNIREESAYFIWNKKEPKILLQLLAYLYKHVTKSFSYVRMCFRIFRTSLW